jgi:hypothetical protein
MPPSDSASPSQQGDVEATPANTLVCLLQLKARPLSWVERKRDIALVSRHQAYRPSDKNRDVLVERDAHTNTRH